MPVARGDGKTLRIFMWSDYIDPQVVKDFEKARGVRVVIDTFESNEAMLAKLQGAVRRTTSPRPATILYKRWSGPDSSRR